MQIYDIIWIEKFVDKITEKHHVTTEEVEDILFSAPHVRQAEKGRVKGEDLYTGYGQTEAGRYLIVFFIRKHETAALPISDRDMTQAERRYYDGQKRAR